MKAALFVTLSALALSGATARAQAIPRWDVNASCAELGRVRPVPLGDHYDPVEAAHNVQRLCLQTAQQDYDHARALWPYASPETRQKCLGHVVTPNFPAHTKYGQLAACLDALLPGQQLQQQGPFHY
jgi:hypothetical protein